MPIHGDERCIILVFGKFSRFLDKDQRNTFTNNMSLSFG